MRILVTFAVDAEFAPWRRRHDFEATPIPTPVGSSNRAVYQGTVHGNQVEVLLTGIGWPETDSPRSILRELLKKQPGLCISSGLAGGLSKELRASDVVAARRLRSGTGGEAIHNSESLLELAERAGARIAENQITETRVVSEASAKSALSALADFVDMESYRILEMTKSFGVPSIAVRAISDTVEQNLPLGLEKLVDREGHVQKLQVLKLLVRQPAQVPSLVNLGVQSKDAALALADFLDRFIAFVGGDTSEAKAKQERIAAR